MIFSKDARQKNDRVFVGIILARHRRKFLADVFMKKTNIIISCTTYIQYIGGDGGLLPNITLLTLLRLLFQEKSERA